MKRYKTISKIQLQLVHFKDTYFFLDVYFGLEYFTFYGTRFKLRIVTLLSLDLCY